MKTKVTQNYRITINGVPAGISYAFDEGQKGIPVERSNGEHDAVFQREFMANRAIERLHGAREAVAKSLFPSFKAFKPLFFDGELEVEPFEVGAEEMRDAAK